MKRTTKNVKLNTKNLVSVTDISENLFLFYFFFIIGIFTFSVNFVFKYSDRMNSILTIDTSFVKIRSVFHIKNCINM